MSAIRDIIAIASVISNVASKNAALRSIASENKWKTSSVLRQVGHERQSVPSYDNFQTEGEVRPQDDHANTTSTTNQARPTEYGTDGSPKADFIAAHEAQDQAHVSDKPSGTLNTSQSIDQNSVDNEDIFVLRGARSVGQIGKRPGKSDKAQNGIRFDSDAFRPTKADRYNIRSTKDEVAVQDRPEPWRPQTAIDTSLSAEQETAKSTEDTSANAAPRPKQSATNDTESLNPSDGDAAAFEALKPSVLSSSAVPSSRISRLYHYGSLGASLGYNAFADSAKRLFSGPQEGSSGLLSSRNTDLLVQKLSRMRGAALKLGQMISFQDENLPGPIREVLQRVQDAADYMPEWQLNKVMSSEFGSDWRSLFSHFDDVPIAAASIGQVHKATLPDGREVAVKVQYPGVANSISSDLSNLSLLLTASRLLPKGLYLNKTIENARTELAWECDYIREAENTKKFRALVGENEVFTVPKVIEECSGKQVLTTEFLKGVGIAKSQSYSQELRDFLGTEIMKLCLREIAEFRFMQTDPNWTNFLYNKASNKIELLDFGACRSFDKAFVDKYCQLLVAAAHGDKATIQKLSTDLGYLTGSESNTMVNAHISSILALSEPFSMSSPDDVFSFENQTVTDRVKSFIPVMLRERLAPPPEETYSLHRRLSGHFLLCARMKSRIPCKAIFKDVMTKAGYMA